jgi:8-oxo-dGTP pyrophosphatase MutT (NUDIX family)
MSQPRHTSRGIIIHDNKILLIERWRGSLHYFSIPGGGIEAGETEQQTVIREVAEETGCTVALQRKLYVLHHGDRMHHIYLCDYLNGTPHLTADSPEALAHNPHNRFEPMWLPVTDLHPENFFIWRPIISQLVNDLANGFTETVVEIAET